MCTFKHVHLLFVWLLGWSWDDRGPAPQLTSAPSSVSGHPGVCEGHVQAELIRILMIEPRQTLALRPFQQGAGHISICTQERVSSRRPGCLAALWEKHIERPTWHPLSRPPQAHTLFLSLCSPREWHNKKYAFGLCCWHKVSMSLGWDIVFSNEVTFSRSLDGIGWGLVKKTKEAWSIRPHPQCIRGGEGLGTATVMTVLARRNFLDGVSGLPGRGLRFPGWGLGASGLVSM